MKKYIFSFFILLISIYSFGQNTPDRKIIDAYINKLNNNCVQINVHYGKGILLDSIGAYLVEHSNKYILENLINSLDDTSKIIVSHVILTKIFEISPHKLSMEDISKDSNLRYRFRYNGFTWCAYDSVILKSKRIYYFDTNDINKVKLYWRGIQNSPIYKNRISN